MSFDWFEREKKNNSVNLLCHQYLIIYWEKKKKHERRKKEIWWSFNQFGFKMKCPCMQIDEDQWENFIALLPSLKYSCLLVLLLLKGYFALAKKKLSCGAGEGHLGCHYWISVLTNWSCMKLSSRGVLLTFFLSFCWHNIEVLIGQW